MLQRRGKIETNLSVWIPHCSLGLVDDNQSSTAGCNRVSKEVVGRAVSDTQRYAEMEGWSA